MGYEVISRFYDRERSVYVDPGAPCPPLDAATATRLVRAGCLAEVTETVPAAKPKRTKSTRTKAQPTAVADDAGE